MADPATVDRPFPPGDYPLIVVGSGPGGLQLSYSLSCYGVAADPGRWVHNRVFDEPMIGHSCRSRMGRCR